MSKVLLILWLCQDTCNFSTIKKELDTNSDGFTYNMLRQLTSRNLLEKTSVGRYHTTQKGKRYLKTMTVVKIERYQKDLEILKKIVVASF